jgi:hypothetical protein
MRKLWKKLFTKNSEADERALHTVGATVRHRNPFEQLEVPRNSEPLDKALIDRFVVPFYMSSLSNLEDDGIRAFAIASKEINLGIVKTLLGEFDWRPRITAAYFAAINNYKELDGLVGRHLLKSDVAYAGAGYCLALAAFDTSDAKQYLTTYLEYYLQQTELWFDQGEAFCALEMLDQPATDVFKNKWKQFVSDKTNWDIENIRNRFSKELQAIAKIRSVAMQA